MFRNSKNRPGAMVPPLRKTSSSSSRFVHVQKNIGLSSSSSMRLMPPSSLTSSSAADHDHDHDHNNHDDDEIENSNYNNNKYPISPQLIYGKEMLHFSHPRHPLSNVCLADLFTCSGCKEYGAGKRFTCQQCDFQLHEFCALSPPALKAHPFHPHHQLLFYSKPVKGGIMQSKCDLCAKPIKGFAFRCGICSFQLHPCCAMFSLQMNLSSAHRHTLRMAGSTTTTGGGGVENYSFTCGECKRKRSGKVYRCTVCDYHLHAVCAKNMLNGLYEYGHKGAEKPSMFGTAAKLASQVVVEFLGGIIEGLGEGVGEAFVQNIKGKGPPSSH